MMLQTLVIINVCIFFLLSMIHFYWALGGSLWIKNAIPEKYYASYMDIKNRTKIRRATVIVAFGLLLFAIIIASNYYPLFQFIPKELSRIATRIIAGLFMLRAIGDFNIVGLFKKSKHSLFDKSDNQIYIPLCLYLSISCALISLL